MQNLTSQAMVQSLVDAYAKQNADLRQKHVFEQTLYALVRLAKSEQIMEIKANVRKLAGEMPVMKSRPMASNTNLVSLAQLALPGLEEKIGAQSASARRRK